MSLFDHSVCIHPLGGSGFLIPVEDGRCFLATANHASPHSALAIPNFLSTGGPYAPEGVVATTSRWVRAEGLDIKFGLCEYVPEVLRLVIGPDFEKAPDPGDWGYVLGYPTQDLRNGQTLRHVRVRSVGSQFIMTDPVGGSGSSGAGLVVGGRLVGICSAGDERGAAFVRLDLPAVRAAWAECVANLHMGPVFPTRDPERAVGELSYKHWRFVEGRAGAVGYTTLPSGWARSDLRLGVELAGEGGEAPWGSFETINWMNPMARDTLYEVTARIGGDPITHEDRLRVFHGEGPHKHWSSTMPPSEQMVEDGRMRNVGMILAGHPWKIAVDFVGRPGARRRHIIEEMTWRVIG